VLPEPARSFVVGVDPDLALAGFVDTVNAWRINGDTVLAVGIGHLVVLLAQLGHYHGARAG